MRNILMALFLAMSIWMFRIDKEAEKNDHLGDHFFHKTMQDEELKIIFAGVEPKINRWENLRTELFKPANEYIDNIPNPSHDLVLSIFSPMLAFDIIVEHYITKLAEYADLTQNALSLDKRHEYLSLLRQYVQEEATNIDQHINETEKRIKTLIEDK